MIKGTVYLVFLFVCSQNKKQDYITAQSVLQGKKKKSV